MKIKFNDLYNLHSHIEHQLLKNVKTINGEVNFKILYKNNFIKTGNK